MEASTTKAPGAAGARIIEPPKGWMLPDLREVWAHRDLIYFLIRRDVVVRYKQAVVGAAWAVVQPMLLAVVFSVFFGLLAKVPSAEGVPYPLLVVSGMVMWLSFSNATERAASSTLENQALISKIYLPRVIIPLAAVVPSFIDFLFGFAVVVTAALAYGFVPDVRILAMPVFLFLAVMIALGAGLWLSALNVKYRDVGLLIPFVILVGMFITPIAYPIDLIPENLQAVYSINPMVGVIEGFRWSLALGTAWPGELLLISVGAGLVLLVTGALYFKRAEHAFADVI